MSSAGAPPSLPAPLYIGSANAWEMDENDHLNVRFHLERAMAGLAHLGAALHMPRAFAADAGATLLPLDAHIRFIREARTCERLIMHGGVLELGESDVRVCLDMRHGDGAPCSAFTLRAAHAEPRDLKAFGWSQQTRAAAGPLMCAQPAHAAPRSIDPKRASSAPSLARAEQLGVLRTGGFLVTPDQCDAFGRMRAEWVFGRASDSVPNLLSAWREMLAEAVAEAGTHAFTPGGAVVEARMVFRHWPRAGDLIEVRSGVVEVGEKTVRLMHWLLDPVSGGCWASVEVVSVTIDTDSRKIVAAPPAVREALAERLIPQMMD